MEASECTKKKGVPEEVVRKTLEAGRQAPPANNRQPCHFIVITDGEIKEKLSQGRWNRFVKDHAFTIVGCAYTSDSLSEGG